jgi:transcription initiation factor TFIIIB Brf1 subunit/transcription initiation factor TFIIB
VPDDGFVGRISYQPRALNYYRNDGQTRPENFAPMQVGGDPRFSLELLSAARAEIGEAFFVDLFQTIQERVRAGTTPTAREVQELAGEKMFLLGPMLVQQQSENHDALFDRLFSIKLRRGELPPVPPELAGQALKVEYVSPLALAQREQVTQNILGTYQDAAMLAQIGGPQVLDALDHDEALRAILRQRNYPRDAVNDEAAVRALREQRAKAQVQAAQAAGLNQALESYRDMAAAPEEGSPAASVLGALGGA